MSERTYRVLAIVIFFLCVAELLCLCGCVTTSPRLVLEAPLQDEVRLIGDAQYIPIVRLCEVYGLDWKWDDVSRAATLKGDGGEIIVMAGSDKILVNGYQQTLRRPAILHKSALYVPLSFVKHKLGRITSIKEPKSVKGTRKEVAMIAPAVPSKRYAIKTVVVDAGHGGKDPGAISKRYRLKEKDLNLFVTKRLKLLLEKSGINVILTRDRDRFISLRRRAEIANLKNADLFVSIHTNASRSRWVNGFECYYLSDATDDHARALAARENASLKFEEGSIAEHSGNLGTTLWDMELTENRIESRELASFICNFVRGDLSAKTGVKSARFYVLKWTRMPAVLVEMGYLSNRYEEKKLQRSAYLNRMAEVLARGILAYKKEYERTNGFTN